MSMCFLPRHACPTLASRHALHATNQSHLPFLRFLPSSRCFPKLHISSLQHLRLPATSLSRRDALRTRLLCRRSLPFLPSHRRTTPFHTYFSSTDCAPTICRSLCRGAEPLHSRSECSIRLGGGGHPGTRHFETRNASPSRENDKQFVRRTRHGWMVQLDQRLGRRALDFVSFRGLNVADIDRSTRLLGGNRITTAFEGTFLRQTTTAPLYSPSKARPLSMSTTGRRRTEIR
jgi:hypothetical protein